MPLGCSKFCLRTHCILTEINNHFTGFVLDPVRSCRILYDCTFFNFTECRGVLLSFSKIPYHRILQDLIGFSRILWHPAGFHMILSLIQWDLFQN